MDAINILDIVVICLTVLLLLFGLWRGMFKMIYGLLSAVAGLVLAIVLMNPVVTFVVDNTQADEALGQALSAPINGTLANGDQVIAYYDLDGDPETPDALGYIPTGESEPKPFSDIMEGSRLAFMSGTIEKLAAKSVPTEVTDDTVKVTLVQAVTAAVVSYILLAAAFIVLSILFYILIRILCILIKKLVRHTYIGYYLDKTLGCVFGVALSLLLVFAFLTVVRVLANYEFITPVMNMIESSKVSKLLYNNNFLYTLLSGVVDLQSLFDKLISAIGKVA